MRLFMLQSGKPQKNTALHDGKQRYNYKSSSLSIEYQNADCSLIAMPLLSFMLSQKYVGTMM